MFGLLGSEIFGNTLIQFVTLKHHAQDHKTPVRARENCWCTSVLTLLENRRICNNNVSYYLQSAHSVVNRKWTVENQFSGALSQFCSCICFGGYITMHSVVQ